MAPLETEITADEVPIVIGPELPVIPDTFPVAVIPESIEKCAPF